MRAPPPEPALDGVPGSTTVLVVGGGPVGLVTSLLLTQQGIDHVVVERRTGGLAAPAAHVIGARTFEILRSAGVDMDQVLAACAPAEDGAWVRWVTTLVGDELGRVPFERQHQLAELDVVTPTPLRNLSQHRLEAANERLIRQHRVEIHRYLRHANALAPGRYSRMQIGQRFLVIEPSDFGHKALDEPEHALGAVDESALDFARVRILVAIAAFVEEALGSPSFFRWRQIEKGQEITGLKMCTLLFELSAALDIDQG